MRDLLLVVSACLGACGDNYAAPPDGPSSGGSFRPAPHAPMPVVEPHTGTVLSSVALVTATFDDYAARADVEAFGDAVVRSDWYASVGAEYGLSPGAQVGRLSLGPTPASVDPPLDRMALATLVHDALVTPPAPDQLYLVYVPPGVALGDDMKGIRGYHQLLVVSGVRIALAVAIDNGHGLAATTTAAASALVNAATNPFAPLQEGYYADPPMDDPWSLLAGGVADLCAGEDPVTESGFKLPRIYSSMAASSGNTPCIPATADDAWTEVSAEPADVRPAHQNTLLTFTLTGWSTRPVPDWNLTIERAPRSDLSLEDMQPSLSTTTINNDTGAILTLHSPPGARDGAIGGVIVRSGPTGRPWAVSFVVNNHDTRL